jgi:uncharacterized protein YrrD
MQFKEGTKVYTSDGKDVVGHVDRVVLNPGTKEVTDIVVRKGFLFTEDKVVPISLIAAATEDGVTLQPGAGDLDRLPSFEEVHYLPLNEAEQQLAAYPTGMAMPMYWYPPYGGGWMGYAEPFPIPVETKQNIPGNTVAVREGASVLSADDKEVGTVERVLTGPDTDRATYMVISQGGLLQQTTKKIVPTTWIHDLSEDEVHLTVNSSTVDSLRTFQEG